MNGGNMKSWKVTCVTAMTLFAALTVSVRLTAQEQQEHIRQANYRIFNLGTFGGTSSAGNSINNLGWVTGTANLTDDKTEHAALWAYGLNLDLGTL